MTIPTTAAGNFDVYYPIWMSATEATDERAFDTLTGSYYDAIEANHRSMVEPTAAGFGRPGPPLSGGSRSFSGFHITGLGWVPRLPDGVESSHSHPGPHSL